MSEQRFKVVIGPHDMSSLELRNPTREEREFLKYALNCNLIGEERYELSQQSGAFLQCDYKDYVLVEFWKADYEPFVTWLNDNYDHWVRHRSNGELK